MTTIRRATADDIPTIARTLTLAFADYVWTRWTVPADDYLRRMAELFTIDLTELGIVMNETWITDDGSAAAVWIPPKDLRSQAVDWDRHNEACTPLFGDRLAVLEAADDAIAPHRPTEPSWYLATMGVHPDFQRKGLGAAVMRPVLDRCDAEGMACSLETSSPGNVAFYERQGFAVHAEVPLPEDGPPVWIMWREPR